MRVEKKNKCGYFRGIGECLSSKLFEWGDFDEKEYEGKVSEDVESGVFRFFFFLCIKLLSKFC